MKTIPRRLRRDAVAFEPYLGDGAYGPLYGAAFTVLGKVSMTRQLVRNVDGAEVVSEMTVYLHPADATAITPQSRATYAGRVATVLSVSPQGRPGETVEVKVTCT